MRRFAWLAGLLLVLGLVSDAFGQGETGAPQPRVVLPFADVTVTNAATTVRAANGARLFLNCTNNDAAVNVRWGSASVTATSGQRLKAGASIQITGTYLVAMISEGANVTVSCTEETR